MTAWRGLGETCAFQSTPPVKAATKRNISLARKLRAFQSTPPVKAATSMDPFTANNLGFQSTPPVKAATKGKQKRLDVRKISIHAAREGGDRPSVQAR